MITWDLSRALRVFQHKDPHGGAVHEGHTLSEEELEII